MVLKNENKTSLIQAILFHDAIGRTKTALDQLRDGLSLTNEAVVSRLKFPTSMDDEEKRVNGFLTELLLASSQDTLNMFLTFVTGASCLPYFGLKTLPVKFSEQPSIFASTCLCEITLPKTFVDEDHFKLSVEAVLKTCGKSFNCI